MKKTICLIISTLIMCIFWINEVFAYTDVQVNLSSDKNIVKKEEEIEIVLSVENAKTAAFTANIYFDTSYFEYVNGPKMSNLDNNRIIYVWYDENGIGDSKDGELARFKFRAKKDGTTSFNINGEFFDEDGDVIEAKFKDFEIRIGEEAIEEKAGEIRAVNEDVNDTSNTNLETLAVENMLLYPPFDNNITNYNIEVPNDVKDLNILVVPENEKARVKINGGENLNEGNNSIKITITAQDGIIQKVFYLNAYKRNQPEEETYLREQEENKEKLEKIYNTQKTNTDVEEISVNTGLEKNLSEEVKTKKYNSWIVVVIVTSIVFIVCIFTFMYKVVKKNKK